MDTKNSLKTLKHVLELVERYKLDSIEFNGIKITKSKHVMPEVAQKKQPRASNYPTTIEELDAEAMSIAGLGV